MAFIEPIQFKVEVSGNPDLRVERDPDLRWSNGTQWVVNQLLERYESIRTEHLMEEIQETIQGFFAPLEGVEKGFVKVMIDNVVGDTRGARPFVIYYSDDVMLIPAEQYSGVFFLISSRRELIDDVIGEIREEMNELSEVAETLGITMELITEKQYTSSIVDGFDSEIVQEKDFDNEFEETVANEIRDYLTRSFESNIVLQFGDADPETFEYDVLIPVSARDRVIIEVKDATHDESNLGKSQLIDKPRDKSDIIDTEEGNQRSRSPPVPPRRRGITRTFVVVRGMGDEQFDQHKRKAERRDIQLVKYDEQRNYLEEIEFALKEMVERVRSY